VGKTDLEDKDEVLKLEREVRGIGSGEEEKREIG